MITRAQAEALLTLAESLEACERLGLTLKARFNEDIVLRNEGEELIRSRSCRHMEGMQVRVALRMDRLKAKGVF